VGTLQVDHMVLVGWAVENSQLLLGSAVRLWQTIFPAAKGDSDPFEGQRSDSGVVVFSAIPGLRARRNQHALNWHSEVGDQRPDQR
jgi:hypothetical protein